MLRSDVNVDVTWPTQSAARRPAADAGARPSRRRVDRQRRDHGRYVAEGAAVTLVTCTLGEEGEVLVPDLAHLAADQGDELGAHRLGELKEAMDILGVTDFVRLGGDGRFRDSGMAYDDDGQATARDVLREGIFWTTDLLEAANELVPLIRDRRPQVLVTYNEFGGYGHPDHIQAHRVAMYGYQLAGVPRYRPDLGAAWRCRRVLWTTMSRTRMARGIRALRAAGDTETFRGFDPEGGLLRWSPTTRPSPRDRRRAVGPAEAGRHAGARHPDHRGRAVLRRSHGAGRQRCGRTSHYRFAAGDAASRLRRAGPTTSSPAWMTARRVTDRVDASTGRRRQPRRRCGM